MTGPSFIRPKYAIERLCMRGLRRLGAIHRGFKIYGESTCRYTPIREMAKRHLPTVPFVLRKRSGFCAQTRLPLAAMGT